MARNLSVGVQRGLRQSIGGGLGTGDIFTLSSASFDFARTGTADSRITHTRASSATYVDGDGVIKSAVTNLLLQSENLTVSPWTSVGAVVTEDYTQGVPFEGAKVYKIVFSAANQAVSQGISYLAKDYAASIYVKGTQGDVVRFSGKTGQSAANYTLNGEWERLSQTFTATAVTANFNINTSGLSAVTVYVAAPQLEQSTTVGEYVKTTSTINSAPRFDHDPTTGESLGLLVEESRTNLITQSEDLSVGWSLSNVLPFGSGSIINAITSPDGLVSADKITEDTATSFHRVLSNFSITSGQTYVLSAFVKAAERTKVHLQLSNNLFKIALFDLAAGSTSSPDASITDYGNGWYRCTLHSTATATGSAAGMIEITNDSGSRNYTGDGTSGIYVWGAQLEAGSFLTSYIPTSGSTVTRAADVTEITGTNFSSWYNQTEGTVFASGVARAPDTKFPNYAEINDGSLNNRINFGYLTDTLSGFVVRESGAITSQLYPPTSAVFRKSATAISSNDFAISADGGTVLTTNSGNLYTPIVAMSVGANGVHTGNFMNGTIFRLTYWPERLPNATLQTITF